MRIGAAVRAVTVAVLATVAAAVLPGSAHAVVEPVVNYASSDSAEHLGVLKVSVTSDSDIVTLRAHVVSYATGQDVAVTDDFVLRSGTRSDGVWVTPEPLRIAALGFYRVDVEATDADGDFVSVGNAGSLNYTILARFDPLVPNRTTVDDAHRTVTVRSRLTGLWPTGEVRPLAGLHVSVEVDYLEVTTAVTGTDGRFSATVPMAAAGSIQAVYRPFVDGRTDITGGDSAQVAIALQPAPTRLTATVDRTRVPEGGSFVLRGRLTSRSGGSWHPLAGVDVGVLYLWTGGGDTIVGAVTTGADGSYETTISPYATGRAEVHFTSTDPYQAAAVATTAEVHVLRTTVVRSFTAERTDAATVTVSGAVDFPGGFQPADTQLDVEFSRTGASWTRVATRPAYWTGEGFGFTDSFAQSRSGYWRIRHRANGDFLPVVSDPVFVPAG